MDIAVRNFVGTINQGDTAELYSELRINGQPVTEDQIISVTYTIQLPDLTSQTEVGSVLSDGQGFYRWTTTSEIGEYLVQAQFALVTGEVRSVMDNFTVIDPFNPPEPTDTDMIVEQVMLRLEDCFDSVEGGPWLRDRSFNHFDAVKIAAYIPEALLDINVQMPPSFFPIEMFTEGQDTPNPNMPILVKAVLVLTIRHLMRSYVEQPTIAGGQLVWQDRTKYTQMWNQLYTIEYQDYIAAVRLWKRTTLNLGNSALLTFNKAGRLFPYASQRARGIGRGYY
jgi:hypothetical protein